MTAAFRVSAWLALVIMGFPPAVVYGQAAPGGAGSAASQVSLGAMQPPVMDDAIYTHALLEQLEGRWNGRDAQFRYDGQIWSGTDLTKLWVKSEGLVGADGGFSDGQHEVLLDRAVSPYFDVQGGVRMDVDDASTRTWAALGVQGMSLYFFDVEATGYLSDRGRTAARVKTSFDLLLTQRLVLQPEAELNVYGKSDAARSLGSGVSDLDAGIRLRYEISRKFAPYVGVTYAGRFFQSAAFVRRSGQDADEVRFAFGVRAWF